MNLRKRLTILTAKMAGLAVRAVRGGQGTALPGLMAEKMAPNLLQDYAAQIPEVILITGTNGKTTTQQAVASVLHHAGKKVLANSSGSNMQRGLLSLFIKKGGLSGKLDYDVAVLEIEEATMPKVAKELNPTKIIVTNLFRDQLDAYGEIERTRKMIVSAIKACPKAVVIYNTDDPKLRNLPEEVTNKCVSYGIDQQYLLDFKYEGAKGSKKPDYYATGIKIAEDLGSRFKVGEGIYAFNSPGIYNVYNALAAVTLASLSGLSHKEIANGLLLSKIAFGRGELITKNGISFRMLLTKNPAGMNLVLKLLTNVSSPKIIMLLNDKIADGRDVSWIWDSNFEQLKKMDPSLIILGGSRAEELLLRIKYVYGSARQIAPGEFIVGDNLRVILQKQTPKMFTEITQKQLGEYFFVIPTYTAMLAFRKYISGKAIDD